MPYSIDFDITITKLIMQEIPEINAMLVLAQESKFIQNSKRAQELMKQLLDIKTQKILVESKLYRAITEKSMLTTCYKNELQLINAHIQDLEKTLKILNENIVVFEKQLYFAHKFCLVFGPSHPANTAKL